MKTKFSLKKIGLYLYRKFGGMLYRQDAFICCSNRNTYKAREVRKFLEKFPYMRVFMAPESIQSGVDYVEEIKENIKNCDFFIPLLSKEMLNSSWPQQEIGAAIIQDKKIFPIVIDKIPENKLAFLGKVQYSLYPDLKWKKDINKQILKTTIKYVVIYFILTLIIVYITLKQIRII